MRVILDTHAYAWWADGDPRLSRAARALIEDQASELLLSAVVPWELATKFRIGKWREAGLLLDDLKSSLAEQELTALPISLAHAQRAGLLPGLHRDPFDRILAAQGQIEDAVIITADPAIARFGVEVAW